MSVNRDEHPANIQTAIHIYTVELVYIYHRPITCCNDSPRLSGYYNKSVCYKNSTLHISNAVCTSTTVTIFFQCLAPEVSHSSALSERSFKSSSISSSASSAESTKVNSATSLAKIPVASTRSQTALSQTERNRNTFCGSLGLPERPRTVADCHMT